MATTSQILPAIRILYQISVCIYISISEIYLRKKEYFYLALIFWQCYLIIII